MRWMEWKLSARLALQDHFVFWVIIALSGIIVATSLFFLWRILPEGWRSGVITMHYTIYLGIDDVRSWPWAFAIPGFALGAVALDIVMALALFKSSPLASRTLLSVALVAALLWASGSFFLTLVNV